MVTLCTNNKWLFEDPQSVYLVRNKAYKVLIKKYLIFLNSPNNPSGQVCTNLSEISQLTKKYNLYFLSDEIYSELTFEDNYQSISNYSPENTIISTGLSKWCGAGGWRVGFFAVPKKLSNFLETIVTLASESYSTVNTPTQFAAVEAYNGNYESYRLKVRAILNAVGTYVYNNLKSNKVISKSVIFILLTYAG